MQVAPSGSILRALSDLVQTPVGPARPPNAVTRSPGGQTPAAHAEAGNRPRSGIPPATAGGARAASELAVFPDPNAPRGTYLDILV